MNIMLNGHTEAKDTLHQSAVSLTPDILKILEETREGAMEELDAVGDYTKKPGDKIRKLLDRFKRRHDWSAQDLIKFDAIEVIDNNHIKIAGFIHRIGEIKVPRNYKKGIVYTSGGTFFTYEGANNWLENNPGYAMYSKDEFNKLIDALPLFNSAFYEFYIEHLLRINSKGSVNRDGTYVYIKTSNPEANLWLKPENGLPVSGIIRRPLITGPIGNPWNSERFFGTCNATDEKYFAKAAEQLIVHKI